MGLLDLKTISHGTWAKEVEVGVKITFIELSENVQI